MKRYQHNSYSSNTSRRQDMNRDRNFNRRDGFLRRPYNFESDSRRDTRNRSPHADSHTHHGHHRRNLEDNPSPSPVLNINEIASTLTSTTNPNQITTILASAINAAFLAGTMNSGGNTAQQSSTADRRQFDRDTQKRPRPMSFSPPPPPMSRHTRPNNNSFHENNENQTRTLFIGNLDRSISEAELRDVFEEFGLLEDVDIKTTSNGEKSYAFVRFQNMDIASRARRALNNKILGKQPIRIAYGKMIPTRCLWIGNLGPWLNYRQLLTFLERHAHPEKVVWSSGNSYAHALFRSVSVATDVADSIKGYVFPGGEKPLKIDFIDDARMLKTLQNRFPQKYVPGSNRPDSHSDNVSRRTDQHSRDRSRRYASPIHNNNHPRGSPRRRKISIEDENRSMKTKRPHTPFSDASENSIQNLSEISTENDGVRSHQSKSANAKSYYHLTKILPEVWKGIFNLKTCSYECKMFLINGNISLINQFIKEPEVSSGSPNKDLSFSNGEPKTPPEEGEQIDEEEESSVNSLIKNGVNLKNIDLMITQRMKLESGKLEELKGQLIGDRFCLLLATESVDNKSNEQNSKSLPNLVNYLKEKDAAGIVMLDNKKFNGDNNAGPGALLHVFPPCQFAVGLIQKFCAPRLEKESNCDTDRYLLVAIVKDNV